MNQKYILYFLLFTTAIHAPLVAQKAVKLNSSTFGQMEARAIGPAVMGGRISAIEGVNILVVITDSNSMKAVEVFLRC